MLTNFFEKKNSLIAETKQNNFHISSKKINFNKIGFKSAFSVKDYFVSKIKDDPRYVKLLARMFFRDWIKRGLESENNAED